MNEMDQNLINDFLVESYESLDQLDRDLVTLEENPNKEVLDSVFRTIHTIKGTCGFLGFGKLESISHVGENLLSRLREGSIQITPQITTGLLALVDAIRQVLSSIEKSGTEGDGDFSTLIVQLTQLRVKYKRGQGEGDECPLASH